MEGPNVTGEVTAAASGQPDHPLAQDEQSDNGEAAAGPPAIPLPYIVGDDGKKQPLPGVQSIFLRGNTAAAMGLSDLSSKAGGQISAAVPKEKILADIQFQGAISDFHPIKDSIKAADYDLIVIRLNEDDLYGDGNNYEAACTKAAADAWQAVEDAIQQQAAAVAAASAAAAAEAALPRSKRRRGPQPWKDQGTEAELAAAAVTNQRPAAVIEVSRARREFGRPCAFADTNASELWVSNMMECRPFKDVNYDLKRMERDNGVQAVPVLRDAAAQATGGRPVPGSTQYSPRGVPQPEKEAILASAGMARFLERACYKCEEALLQNNVTNIFVDDLSLLADDEGAGATGRQDGARPTEAQSFTDLIYSKNKVVSYICWVPNRRGAIAVACTDPASHTERLARNGRLSNAYILVWNMRDPIHPEYVLESPHEVFCFQFNPVNPYLIAGGCYNGQLVVWDTTAEMDRITAVKAPRAQSTRGSVEEGGDETAAPIIRHQYMSAVEYSHTSLVADLAWLPGIEIDRQGKVFAVRAGSAGTGPHALARSQTLGAAALAASAAGSNVPRECCFIATTAADGKVMFWDVRVDKLLKKGAKKLDESELVWRPMHVVHLLSLQGMDFAGQRLCLDRRRLESGDFLICSGEGELLLGNFIRPPGVDNPDYCKHCHQPHAGPIVCLARSPFFEDLILSVGDWTFRLWQGSGSTCPLFTSPYAADCYTAACWSPTRPAVLFLADSAGCLQVWDLLDRSHGPCLVYNVASSAIMSLSFNISQSPSHTSTTGAAAAAAGPGRTPGPPAAGDAGGTAAVAAGSGTESGSVGGGDLAAAAAGAHGGGGVHHGGVQQLLAVGDSTGVLHLLELPRTLRRPLANEKKQLAAFVAREAARVADVAGRQASRVLLAKAAVAGGDATAMGAAGDGVGEDGNDAVHGKDLAGNRVTAPGLPTGGMANKSSTLGLGSSSFASAGTDQGQLDKAEQQYRKLEHEFKVQLGLVAGA